MPPPAQEVETKFRTEHDALQQEYESVRAEVLARAEADSQAAEQALQDSHWEALEAADAARGGLNLPMKDLSGGPGRPLAATPRDPPTGGGGDAAPRTLGRPPPPAPTNVILDKHPGRRFYHALEQAQAQWRALGQAASAGPVSRASPLLDVLPALDRGGGARGSPCWDRRTGCWVPLSFGCAALVGAGGRHLDLPRRQAAVRGGLSRPAADPVGGRTGKPADLGDGPYRLPAAGRRDHRPAQGPDAEGRPGARRRHRTDPTPPRARLAAGRRQLSETAGRVGGVARRDAPGRSRRSIPPCSARWTSVIAAESREDRDPPRPAPWKRAGSGSSRSGATWPSAGCSGVERVPPLGRRVAGGVPAGVSRLEQPRLGRLDAAGGHSRRDPPGLWAGEAGRDQGGRAGGRTAAARPDRVHPPHRLALSAPFAPAAEGRRCRAGPRRSS